MPLLTPPELRGRVSALESVFIRASNELGAFESGVAAALLGCGAGGRDRRHRLDGGRRGLELRFPSIRNVDRFEDLPVPDAGGVIGTPAS